MMTPEEIAYESALIDKLQACRAERAELLAALTGCVYALGIAEKRMGMDSGVLGRARALLEKLDGRTE